MKLLKRIKPAVAEHAIVLSRKKVGLDNQVLTEDRHVELPTARRQTYDTTERTFALGSEETAWRLTMYTWLLRLAGGRAVNKKGEAFYHDAKLDELLSLLTGDLKNEKVLIWFVFRKEGRAILKRVRASGRKAAIIHGDVSIEKRQQHRARLASGKLDTLCLQFQTARYGLDLSAASTAIYYSRTASSDSYHQSLDRIIHPEKKGPLLGIHLIARDTVDERIKVMLVEKRIKGPGMLRRLQTDLKTKWEKR
jgi:superfamily II DNA or RNA helicase